MNEKKALILLGILGVILIIIEVVANNSENQVNFYSQNLFKAQGAANNVLLNINEIELHNIKFLLINISDIKNGRIYFDKGTIMDNLTKPYVEERETDTQYISSVTEYFNKDLEMKKYLYQSQVDKINEESPKLKNSKFISNLFNSIRTVLIVVIALFNLYILVKFKGEFN